MLLNCGAGEDSFGSPLDCKEIKPINPKGKQPWIFFGSINAEAPILCHLMRRVTHWKRLWCWERLRAGGERGNRGWDGWHHQFNGCEFEQTLRDSEGHQSLASCSPRGCRGSTTERLNKKSLYSQKVISTVLLISRFSLARPLSKFSSFG